MPPLLALNSQPSTPPQPSKRKNPAEETISRTAQERIKIPNTFEHNPSASNTHHRSASTSSLSPAKILKSENSPLASNHQRSISTSSLPTAKILSFDSPTKPRAFIPHIAAIDSKYGSSKKPARKVPETPARKIKPDAYRLQLMQIENDKQCRVQDRTFTLGKFLGSGNFSNVYAATETSVDGHAEQWVVKIPSNLETISSSNIKEHQKNAENQYIQLTAQKDTLNAIGIEIAETIFDPSGIILQKFSSSFTPPWNEDTTWETIQQSRQWPILEIAKRAFAYFYTQNIPADFKPDNIIVDLENKRIILRDFFELPSATASAENNSFEDGDSFATIMPSLLRNWALGNQAVYEWLDARPKKA